MAKKIYWNTMKEWALKAGIPLGVAGFTLLFMYLTFFGIIIITDHSKDIVCAGTENDPCIATITFSVSEDIFLYPMDYDPYGRNTPFYTDKGLKSWKIFRNWGDGWREIKLNETCTGTWCGGVGSNNKYSFAFRKGKNYTIKIEALKEDPEETIKWGFADIDPFWYGINATPTISAENINLELGNQINMTANLSGYSGQVCVDIDHPSYNNSYACGTPSANFLFNISWFRNNQFNDSSLNKTYNSSDFANNITLYVRMHQYDEILNLTLNLTGTLESGIYPNISIYVNNTLSNNVGIVYGISGGILTTFNDSTTSKNFTFSTAPQSIVSYFHLPKNTTINGGVILLNAYPKYCYQETANYSSSSDGSCNLNYTGSYSFSDSWINVTYNKPNISLTQSKILWQVSHGGQISNISIPSGCWHAYPKTILFSEYSFYNSGYGWANSTVYCWDGSKLISLSSRQCSDVSYFAGDTGTRWAYDGNWVNGSLYWNGQWYRDNTIGGTCGGLIEEGIYWDTYSSNGYPTDIIIRIGNQTASPNWNYTGIFIDKNIYVSSLTSSFNDYLDNCIADISGYCDVPINITSSGNGTIQVSDIQIDYGGHRNPIILNKNLIQDFLNHSNGFTNIPITFLNHANGTLLINDLRYDYRGGNKTYHIVAKGNNLSICVQEFANQSYGCGAVGGGSYWGNNTVSSTTAWYDGDWTTSSPIESGASVFVNYTMPSVFYSATSSWKVKTDGAGGANFTYSGGALKDCLDSYSDILQIKITDIGSYDHFYCKNLTDWREIDYGGLYLYEEQMIWNITAEINETLNVTVFYSDFQKSLPYSWTPDVFFLPKTNSSKNVTAYGQTSIKPIFDILTTNYGGKNLNLSIKVNQTYSCLNLTWNTNSTKPGFIETFYISKNTTLNISNISNNSLLVNVTAENNFTHLTIDDSLVPYNNLVAYYPFDVQENTAGKTYDYSKNNNDGTLTNGVKFNTTNCAYGNCYTFDGNSDEISIASTALKSPIGQGMPYSHSLWIYPVSSQTGYVIDDQNNVEHCIWIDTSYRINFNFYNLTNSVQSPIAQTSSNTAPLNTWTYITAVNNGTFLFVYINGVLNASQNTTGYTHRIFNDLVIGCVGTCTTTSFNGSLDEVMIFNQSLNSTQILAIYNNQSSRFKSQGQQTIKQVNITSGYNQVGVNLDGYNRFFGTNISTRLGLWDVSLGYNNSDLNSSANGLVSYWHFDSNNGTINYTADSSGNGNNGQCKNMGSDCNFTSGVYNNSMSFDGSNDYVISTNSSAVISHSLWQKNSTASSWTFVAYNGSTFFVNAVIGLGTMRLYPLNVSGNQIKIGVNFTGSQFFNGSIDEVMIFNRSLSIDEVKELYVKGRANWNYTNYQNLSTSGNVFNISSLTTNLLPDFNLLAGTQVYPFITPNLIFSTNSFNLNFNNLTSNITYPNILSNSWQELKTNLEYLNNTKIWLWADLNNCNVSDKRILRPDLYIESYCKDCIWS
jgi:hypothetical protein